MPTADDLNAGIHAVTVIRCAPADAAELEAVMVADYEYLAQNPAFLSARLVACRVEPGTYFHITHWASEGDLAAAGQDPEIKRILSGLPLAAPLEPHRGDAVVWAAGGTVHGGARDAA
jgi:quinol monooxygenase YgiN